MNKKKILADIQKVFTASQNSRHLTEQALTRWKRAYDGKPYGNEQKHRSSIVVKDIQKHVETMRPSLNEPFLASDTLIKVKATNQESLKSASVNQHTLNYQFNVQFDKVSFIDIVSNVLPREGTIFIRTGWDFEEDKKVKHLQNLDEAQLAGVQEMGGELSDVVQNKDGTFNATMTIKKTIKNQPTAKVCKNESIYTDPTAECFEDSKFIIHEFEMSLSDIKKNSHIYTTPKNEEAGEDRYADSSLGVERYVDTFQRGQDHSFNFPNKSSKKIKLLEYWGEADIDDTGINKQIVCVWIKGTSEVIRLEENPYPDKEIPFVSTPYIREAFTMWGNSVAHSMEDNQKIHTAIMRGFIDNMSLSNNGQKFFQKGAIDYSNMRKLTSGYRFIELNNINGMVDGKYNEMPQASFNIYDRIEQENEALTGVTKNMNGLDAATVGRTASGVSMVMGAAQKRVLMTVRNIANLLSKMFKKWAAYNAEFLDDDTMIAINGQFLQVSREELKGSHSFELRIGMDSQNQGKMQQINMLMQQLQADGEQAVDSEIRKELVAEFFDAMGKNEMAEKIRSSEEPPPSEQEQQMMALEMKMKELEAALEEAKVGQTNADAQLKQVQAQKLAGEGEAIQVQMQNDIMKAENDIDIATAKVEASIENEASKAELQLHIAEQKAALDRKIALEKSRLDMILKKSQSQDSKSNIK